MSVRAIGVSVDVARLLAIAEALREQIPNVSPQASRSMIDAAGELQRIADQAEQARKQIAEILKSLTRSDDCQCAVCQARRVAEAEQKPGSLN